MIVVISIYKIFERISMSFISKKEDYKIIRSTNFIIHLINIVLNIDYRKLYKNKKYKHFNYMKTIIKSYFERHRQKKHCNANKISI